MGKCSQMKCKHDRSLDDYFRITSSFIYPFTDAVISVVVGRSEHVPVENVYR